MLLKVASFYSKNDGLEWENQKPGMVGERRYRPCLEEKGDYFFLEKYFRFHKLARGSKLSARMSFGNLVVL